MKDTLHKDIEVAGNGVEHLNGNGASDSGVAASTMGDMALLSRPKRRPWRIALPILLVLLVAVAAAFVLFRPGKSITTAVATRGTIVSTVETTGKLEAESNANLSFKASGQVTNVLAKQGDAVEAGQVLAELDTAALKRNLDQATTQLEISKLQLQKAKDGARPQDIAAATADLEGALAGLNSARSGGRPEDVAAATAALNQAQAKLDGIKKGATPQDIAAAQAGVQQAEAKLQAVKQPATPGDISQAEAALRQAEANLESVKQPATPEKINQAQAAVREAQAKYDSLKAGATPEDLKAAQAAVDQAVANFNKVKAGATSDDIAGAQAKLDQAKAARDQTASNASNVKEQARLDVVQASNALQNAQDAYGKIKYDNDHVNPKDLNDDDRNREAKALRDVQDAQARVDQATSTYETARANEIAQLNSADAAVREAQAAFDKLKAGPTTQDIAIAQSGVDSANAKLNALKAGPKPEDLAAAQAGVDQAQAQLNAMNAGGSASDVAAAQAGVDKAKAALDQLKAGGSANDIAAAQGDVDKAEAALDKLLAGATPEELRQAQQAVVQAQANLDKVKKGPTADDIKAAQAKVDAAQAALDKVKAGSTPTELAILEQQIALAQITVTNATAQISDAQLKSPISGTLLSMDIEIGETVGGQQKVAVVADTNTLRIKADVDEIDVGKVSAGQAVTVTLDAYPGVKLAGKIERLAPGATQKQGSTIYQATISFTPGEGVTPREGMAASVDITAQRKENVLLLPNRAFETVGTRQYVTILDNDQTRKVEVETGLSNYADTEVISGVAEGQAVVIK
ncbi:MAG: HlyD family efflux transporter periplasmic adaptor subunit [Chloroflexota bacterium]